jgi:uncharacterized HAD superfamily protein
MRIGVDFDDILGECGQAMVEWHNRVYGTKLKITDVTSFDLEHVWKTTREERVRRCEEFLHSKECDKMGVVSGAIKGINKLAKEHKLIVITARLKKISNITQSWLDKYFLNKFEKVCYNEDWDNMGPMLNKIQLCKDNKIDILIDDNIETAKSVSSVGISVILLDYPWNQSKELLKNVTRVKNWSEIIEVINSQTI